MGLFFCKALFRNGSYSAHAGIMVAMKKKLQVL